MLTRLGATVDVLRLEPSDLLQPVPLWETAVEPGAVAVTVVDGSAADWTRAAAVAQGAFAELYAAPCLTVAVVRDGEPAGEAGALVRACDLIATSDDELDALLERVDAAPGPALVAAQLLRGGGACVAVESFAYATLLASAPFASWRHATPTGESEAGFVEPRVAIEPAGAATVVRLTRPLKHNAFDGRMREQLCDALDAVAAVDDGPVVLVGEGRSFCAGGDLDEFGLARDPLEAHLVRSGRSVARKLERIADRLVVGVHGHCIGAGVELASYARVVVAAESASLALPELTLGLSLGAGGSVSIPRRIGRQRTLELLLRGTPVDAAAALRLGLVDEIAPDDDLRARCLERSSELR